MFSTLLTEAYLPFTIALVVMFGIGIIEAIGLGFGQFDIEGDAGGGAEGGWLDWLGLSGELPILIWLTSLLCCFALAGVALQQAAAALAGAPAHWLSATGGALVVGVLLNTLAANGLARVMPRFETTVISSDDLLGRRGSILEGTTRRGSPARAKVIDQHGQAHYIMVEPHHEADSIASGETALLVRREGNLFFALPDKDTFLQSI
jgi:Protein of unknown function (DUF1449)